MPRSVQPPTSPWVAFAAGAVAMLVFALAWFAWQGRDDAALLARTTGAAIRAVPELKPPRVPEAPRIPDNPVPQPK